MKKASFAVFAQLFALIEIFALWLRVAYVLNIVVAADGMGNVTLHSTNVDGG